MNRRDRSASLTIDRCDTIGKSSVESSIESISDYGLLTSKEKKKEKNSVEIFRSSDILLIYIFNLIKEFKGKI